MHAVCSTKDVSNATKLGADLVIDRTKKDVAKTLSAASYDIIFDTSGKYSLMQMRYAMKKGGTFVSTIPHITEYPPFSWIISSVTGKSSKSLMVKCNRQDLELIGGWMKDGGITVPTIAHIMSKISTMLSNANKVVKSQGEWLSK